MTEHLKLYSQVSPSHVIPFQRKMKRGSESVDVRRFRSWIQCGFDPLLDDDQVMKGIIFRRLENTILLSQDPGGSRTFEVNLNHVERRLF